MPILHFKVTDTETGAVIKEEKHRLPTLNKLSKLGGPHWNNHVMYQLKKTKMVRIISEAKGTTVEYRLED